ncbi:DUF1501 domain-containing protein [Haliangium ochraceum]|nr:DUF1501 domain-containing protein [Haliangium ochraceum]
MSRRRALGAFGAMGGGLLWRSLATGIPAKILLDPLRASAEDLPTGRILILSSSQAGDPVNANVPGTYGFSDIFHPDTPEMAETALRLGDVETTAAKPWAGLSQKVLDRTVFFHHATYTPVHGELNRVQRMMDATDKKDMLVAHLARELAPRLGSVQSDPVSLGAKNGGELLTSGGRILGNVSPTSVQQALGGVAGPLADLEALRDDSIDRMYALYRDHGTQGQRRMLDAWARSRDEVRGLSSALVSRLDQINNDGEVSQARTAAVLAAMNITPVITIRLRFGGDNHTDAGFELESEQHQTAIPTLQLLMDELDALRAEGVLQHEVLVGSLNVFGRTLKKKGTAGRDHHAGHHVTVLMGNGLKGGVVGGVELNGSGKEYVAQSIDSTTGAGGDGDIPFEETLGAMGKTLGVAMGIEEARMDQILPPGKVVRSVLA